jgi:hypothetical protein
MRLKISFDDIKLLYNYLDKEGNGFVGYNEFTKLLEERWRGIDPIDLQLKSMMNKHNPMDVSESQGL